jgi:hypothetical protein
MSVVDLVFLTGLVITLGAILYFSKVARLLVVESILHPFRSGYIMIQGDEVTLVDTLPRMEDGSNGKEATPQQAGRAQ